jgi:hypothetical protein
MKYTEPIQKSNLQYFLNLPVDPKQEKLVKRTLFRAYFFCVLAAIIPCLLSLLPYFKPVAETPNLWFQRSGALMTAFSVFSQVTASNLYNMIQGGAFAESWGLFYRYKNSQRAVNIISTVLIIVGTLIWGYGDILFRYIQHTIAAYGAGKGP